MNYPSTWKSVTIGESLDLINGRAFKPTEWSTAGRPIIRIQNLNNPKAGFNYYAGPLPEKFSVTTGDLLFAWSGTPGTSFGAHVWKGPDAWLNQHIFKVVFPEKVFAKTFLQLAINQNLSQYIGVAHGGAGLAHITKGKFESSSLPLPPLPEQKRIVAKIEELFSELEAGEASLRKARRQLGVYRQSLLKQAFEGKLTQKWRTQNPDKLESPASFLARIQSARQARYEQQLKEWESSSGRKPRPPKAALEMDLSDLPSLPASWIWCRLSTLSRVGTGVTPLRSKPEYYEDGDVPWITSTVVNEDVVHEPNGYVTQFALQDTQLQLYPAGSLIVALYGEGKTRGKVSQVAFDTTTNQALAVLVQEGECEKAVRPYLKLYLLKNYSDIRRLSSGGVQPNLNLGLIEQLPVPLCSLPEQQEIVRLLDEQFEAIERNERELDAALQRSEALRQSILKRAFSGRLVPQDPADEPASALLARLRAERATNPSSSTRRRASTA